MSSQLRAGIFLMVLLSLCGARIVQGGGFCRCRSKERCEPCPPRHVCEQVCTKKPITKTVYRVKQVPYCRHNCPCDSCRECNGVCDACVCYRTVLMKKTVKVGEEEVAECKPREACSECDTLHDHQAPAKHTVPSPRDREPEVPPSPARELPARNASALHSEPIVGDGEESVPAPLEN